MFGSNSVTAAIAKITRPPPTGFDQRWLTISLSVLVSAIAVASLGMHLTDHWLLGRLALEDGPFEDFEAIAFFVAAFLLLHVVAGRGLKNVWVLGIALLFFLVGGEEISWGQRIFAIGTPDSVRAVNVQGETNLHNVKGIHETVRALSLVTLWGLFVAIPLGTLFRPTARLVRALGLPVANWGSALAIVAATAFMAIPRVLGHGEYNLDEVGELLVSIAALGLSAGLWSATRRESSYSTPLSVPR
jgi:glucan phosphoethanolaminetransferase (alkaline phosphatase superfamily)